MVGRQISFGQQPGHFLLIEYGSGKLQLELSQSKAIVV